MRYAIANFTKTVDENGENVRLEGYSLAGRPVDITVKLVDINQWLNGASVQEVFPYLTADEREVCISGIDGIQWSEMYDNVTEDYE